MRSKSFQDTELKLEETGRGGRGVNDSTVPLGA